MVAPFAPPRQPAQTPIRQAPPAELSRRSMRLRGAAGRFPKALRREYPAIERTAGGPFPQSPNREGLADRFAARGIAGLHSMAASWPRLSPQSCAILCLMRMGILSRRFIPLRSLRVIGAAADGRMVVHGTMPYIPVGLEFGLRTRIAAGPARLRAARLGTVLPRPTCAGRP